MKTRRSGFFFVLFTAAAILIAAFWISWMLLDTGETSAMEPEGAIGVEAARTLALEDAGLSGSEVTFTRRSFDSGEEGDFYRVEFYTGDGGESRFYEYRIDALTGKVISASVSVRTKEKSAPTSEENEEKEDAYIGVRRAVEIALAAQGLTAAEVEMKEVELETDAVPEHYEVEFTAGSTEYTYKIHAKNGTVLEKETETAGTPETQGQPAGKTEGSSVNGNASGKKGASAAGESSGRYDDDDDDDPDDIDDAYDRDDPDDDDDRYDSDKDDDRDDDADDDDRDDDDEKDDDD